MALKGFLVTLFTLLLSLHVSALSADTAHLGVYYGQDLYQSMLGKNIPGDELRPRLHDVISKGHKSVGYDEARRQIFGKISLQQDGKDYYVKDVYCEKNYSNRDNPELRLGPNSYPADGKLINTEHTWPQSKFTTKYPGGMQKSDIHHLFPSDSKMNSFRGNLNFGEVAHADSPLNCPNGALGVAAGSGETIFEPPQSHRGNIARALFYFAVRYETDIDAQEEKFLRQWNNDDPVDAEEINRNNMVEKIQGNRNPFIDEPQLADQIQNF